MKPPRNSTALTALSVPAKLYGAVMRYRNRRYDRPGAQTRAELPVISVGNLTTGGTGKTPLVAWLARYLLSIGVRPAIVSRGYRGTAGRGPLLVSAGGPALCSAATSGDEPLLLARSVEGAIVVVGSDRVAGVREATSHGAEVAILDDGFQHRALARDLDIVLLDSTDPFGSHRMLPAGLLREPLDGLLRADLVLITRGGRGMQFPGIEQEVRRHNHDVPILVAGHRAVGFFDHRGARSERPERAVAFCGVGNPQRFRDDLEAAGVELVEFRVHPDHHSYSLAKLHALGVDAAAKGLRLLTTEKDLMRISGLADWRGDPPLCVLRIEAEIYEPGPLLERVAAALERDPA